MKLTNKQKIKRNKHVTKMLKEIGINIIFTTNEDDIQNRYRIFPSRKTGGEWKLTLKNK